MRSFVIFFVIFATSPAFAEGCRPGPSGVTLYEHVDFGGRCQRFSIGDYPTDLGLVGDNVTSSIRVGRNVDAELCTRQEFFGPCSTFEGGIRYRRMSGRDVENEMRRAHFPYAHEGRDAASLAQER